MADFQRTGSTSNTHVGMEFEELAMRFWAKRGLKLDKKHSLLVGVRDVKKPHNFDLGSSKPPVIVECKSHKWTTGDNVPSAKMRAWNEAMYYFLVAPQNYRKIFFSLRDICSRRKISLAEYYVHTYAHLIPAGVEVWEYDVGTNAGCHVNKA
jgi:hypothetical protein